jgi:Uma2 family endonuclease
MTHSSALIDRLAHATRLHHAEEMADMHMARAARKWTLEELHRLPDDGNTYELVRGELFVTPPPSVAHEELASVLRGILVPYVDARKLGRVYSPRAVVQALKSQVEPDIMVRPIAAQGLRWSELPVPILVVEILSVTTRRRDFEPKRKFYFDAGVAEYWMIDGWQRTIHVARPNESDVVETTSLTWHPASAAEPLVIDVEAYFNEALGEVA